MRLAIVLSVLTLAACATGGTTERAPSPSEQAGFLQCPGKPGTWYRPGTESVTCND